jgi:hypothetical protein
MDSAKIVDSKPRLAGWAFLDQPVRKRSEPAGRGFVRTRTRACFSHLNPGRCARIIVSANNRIRKPKTYKKRYIICTYSVANVPQIKKTMLQRALKGYKVTRKTKGKVYKSEKNRAAQNA